MSSLDLTGDLTDEYLGIYRDYFKSIEKIGYYIHDRCTMTITSFYPGLTGTVRAIHKAFDEIDCNRLDFAKQIIF